MKTLSRKDIFLVALLTLFWGFNWPIMKFGVQDFPPVTFRAVSMLLALPIMWAVARWKDISLNIPQGYARTIVWLSIPNMLVWNILIILGIRMLSSGRAAILGYTMPVWAVVFSWLLFREKLSKMAWAGMFCAVLGALLLLSGELASFSGQPTGTLMMLVAAAAWGYGTVQMRHQSIPMPSLSLTFWMLASGATALSIYAVLFEIPFWHWPDMGQSAAILYNAALVFGFSNVVWISIARTLPPVVSSLSVMMIPVTGVFSGTWLLAETPHWQDYAAMTLILIAMACVLLKPATAPHHTPKKP